MSEKLPPCKGAVARNADTNVGLITSSEPDLYGVWHGIHLNYHTLPHDIKPGDPWFSAIEFTEVLGYLDDFVANNAIMVLTKGIVCSR